MSMEVEEARFWQIDGREALKRGVEVSVRRLKSLDAGLITDEQFEAAYKPGVDEIHRYFGELGNWNGTVLAARGLGQSSMAYQYRRDSDKSAEWARKELRVELEGFRKSVSKPRKPRRRRRTPKRTEPTRRQKQALDLFGRSFTYVQIGTELGIRAQAAYGLVKRGLENTPPSGRSLSLQRAQALATDNRGQVTTVHKKGKRTKGK